MAAVPYVLAWASPDIASFLMGNFALDIKSPGGQPWTILTYPLASAGYGGAALGIIFLCWWLYMIASFLESELGSWWLIGVFAIATVINGLVAILASPLQPMPLQLAGMHLPEAFLTLIWCSRNQSVCIRLFGVIPITGRLLAILVTVTVMFGYGSGMGGAESRAAPLFGIAVALPLLLAWLYGLDKLPLRYGLLRRNPTSGKKKQKEFDAFISNVRDREKEREEKERLRKLFEDSLDDK
jgi:membrane associated rhomboid family serine protease